MARSDYLRLGGSLDSKESADHFVLESPPVSGLYFCDPEGRKTEPLFRAMMKDVLEIDPSSKEEGLREFAARGYLIIDATYTPVNNLKDRETETIIDRHFPELVADLRRHATADSALVLVKANICDLEQKLKSAHFNVMNNGIRIPFPSNGRQGQFAANMRKTLNQMAQE